MNLNYWLDQNGRLLVEPVPLPRQKKLIRLPSNLTPSKIEKDVIDDDVNIFDDVSDTEPVHEKIDLKPSKIETS